MFRRRVLMCSPTAYVRLRFLYVYTSLAASSYSGERLGIRVYENPKCWRPLTCLYILREPDGNVDLDALHRRLTAEVQHIPEKGTLRVSKSL
jgi:hypothetical protein